jgi:hypothetical protein
MIARFNYTDRITLKHSSIRITVDKGPPRSFDANWNFEGLELPSDAKIYIEAMSGGSPVVMRFPFGTVGERKPPATGTILTYLTGEKVHFTLKVVEETGDHVGQIRGLAENIEPRAIGDDTGIGRQSILPVNPVDLGERLWRLNFNNNRPWLEINETVHGMKDIARDDYRFFARVYPEVIRQILFRALILDGHTEVENDDNSWQDQWLRYAIHWHPEKQPPPNDAVDPLETPENFRVLEDWIEEVVQRFCLKNAARERFVEAEEGQL